MTDAKYIPLTFVTSTSEKERLIRNTMLLRHFGARAGKEVSLSHYIEGTQYGFNASAKESGTNRFVRISDIANGGIEWDTVPFCQCDDPAGYLLYDHDLLVARTGGTTGKSYMVVAPPKDSIFAGYLIRIRANEDTNPRFLSVFLNSYFYWGQITSLNRDEFRPSVNAKKLAALKLPKLDRSVQDEIAGLASSSEKADSSIASEIRPVMQARTIQDELGLEIAHQQSLLAKLKQAILQEAIQGKLTSGWRTANPVSDLSTEASAKVEPARQLLKRIQTEKARLIAEKKIRKEKPLPRITAEEIPFEIPKGWEWCRFGEIVRAYEAGRSFKCEDREVIGSEWGVIKTSAVTSGVFVERENKFLRSDSPNGMSAKIEIGDLIFCRASGSKGLAGMCAIVRECSRNLLLSDKTIRVPLMEGINPDYIALHNSSAQSKGFLNGLGMGKSTTMNNVTRGDLFNKPIPLPPLAEQAAIVERVEALMTTCRALEAEIEQSRIHAAHLLQAVLKEAFAK